MQPGGPRAGGRRPAGRARGHAPGGSPQLVVSAPTPGQPHLAAVGVTGQQQPVAPSAAKASSRPARGAWVTPMVSAAAGSAGPVDQDVAGPGGSGRRRCRRARPAAPRSTRAPGGASGPSQPAATSAAARSGHGSGTSARAGAPRPLPGPGSPAGSAAAGQPVVVVARHERPRQREQRLQRVQHGRDGVEARPRKSPVTTVRSGERRASSRTKRAACAAGRAVWCRSDRCSTRTAVVTRAAAPATVTSRRRKARGSTSVAYPASPARGQRRPPPGWRRARRVRVRHAVILPSGPGGGAGTSSRLGQDGCMTSAPGLKARLQSDLTAAMRARDELPDGHPADGAHGGDERGGRRQGAARARRRRGADGARAGGQEAQGVRGGVPRRRPRGAGAARGGGGRGARASTCRPSSPTPTSPRSSPRPWPRAAPPRRSRWGRS